MYTRNLPSLYKYLVLQRCKESGEGRFKQVFGDILEYEPNSLDGFIWSHTREGDEYWGKIYDANFPEELPELPPYVEKMMLKTKHKC